MKSQKPLRRKTPTKIPCICCGAVLNESNPRIIWKNPDYDYSNIPPKELFNDMIDGGGVEKFYFGYGSSHDGNTYVIGICDKCIAQKVLVGSALIFSSDCITNPTQRSEKSRMKWYLKKYHSKYKKKKK